MFSFLITGVSPSSDSISSKSYRANQPSVNSLMHLYGPWILDACLLRFAETARTWDPQVTNDFDSLTFISVIIVIQNERLMNEALAKSYATLCTIFSSAQSDEFIHPEYLSRFYYVLHQGLQVYQGERVCKIFSNLIFVSLVRYDLLKLIIDSSPRLSVQ